jgi:hypothetical protein
MTRTQARFAARLLADDGYKPVQICEDVITHRLSICASWHGNLFWLESLNEVEGKLGSAARSLLSARRYVNGW